MKSIRHTLIVYFLVLLTAALAAVSWFSYRTTALALRQRQNDSRQLIEKQCDARCENVRADLKRRVLQQAVTMSDTRLSTIHYEAVHSAALVGLTAAPASLLGAFAWGPRPDPSARAREVAGPPASMCAGAVGLGNTPLAIFSYIAHPFAPAARPLDPPMPPARELAAGPIYIPVWFYMARPPFNFGKAYPRNTNIEFGEALVAANEQGHPQEYFQTYTASGHPMQRSASLGSHWFTLEKERRDHISLLYDYDVIELKPGVKLERVTLKTSMSAHGAPWWPMGRGKGFGPKGMGQGNGMRPPPGPQARSIFIQYAADLGPIEQKIRRFHRDRDEQIANLAASIDNELARLRARMFWISLATLVAILFGAYAVIRLGLNPLAKMTEAVRQVSSKNFHLALDPAALPNELQPIATRLEESLQELRKAFAREKQASADISHELRTPLAALMTTLEVGLKKTRSVEQYRDILDECRLSGEHMYHLVERLLLLARLDAGADHYRPTEVDVTATALNCADLIRPLARARNLELRLHLPDTIITRTDGDKLSEILVNLLHNAVEYNKPGGAIGLTIERANGHVRCEVRDSGIGIKPEVREHIFERFYRGDASRHADTPHAGLGLAIVKSYLDLMNGSIRVDSSEAGTTFTVELPFVDANLATAIQAAAV